MATTEQVQVENRSSVHVMFSPQGETHVYDALSRGTVGFSFNRILEKGEKKMIRASADSGHGLQ